MVFKHPISRRDFLKISGYGLFTTSIASALLAPKNLLAHGAPPKKPVPNIKTPATDQANLSPERLKAQAAYPYQDPGLLPEEKRIGYAIVGLGILSQDELLPAFGECKKSKLVALVSGDRAKAEKLAAQYNVNPKNIYDYGNFDRVADNPDIQVVYIVLPNHLHAEYSIRAANAGKHVLCEKPMAMTDDECQAMIDASKKANRKLMVAYRLQYEPKTRRAIEMVRQKEFGQVKHIMSDNCQQQRPDTPWRLDKARGGSPLCDIGIYCLNAMRYLTGEEPIEISARTYTTPADPRFKSIEESFNFFLRFPSGITGAALASYGAYSSKRFRAYATDGWFQMDPGFSYAGLELASERDGKQSQEKKRYELLDLNQFANEMDHMSACVLEGRTPHTPGEEGKQDIHLIQQIRKSAESGQVIQLPAISGLDVFRGSAPTS